MYRWLLANKPNSFACNEMESRTTDGEQKITSIHGCSKRRKLDIF